MPLTHEGASPAPSTGFIVVLWLAMLLIVGAETALTYSDIGSGRLLAGLLVLSGVEAVLGVLYFMHLRYERRILAWTVGCLVFALVMMNQIWFDAVRLRILRH